MAAAAFAVLGIEPRPYPDLEALKRRVAGMLASEHPDRAHAAGSGVREAEARSAEIQEAAGIVRNPARRLALLVELETGARPAALAGLGEFETALFPKIAEACRAAKEIAGRGEGAGSALAAAELAVARAPVLANVTALNGIVAGRIGELERRCKELDGDWMAGKRDVGAAAALARDFAYAARWRAELAEALARLAGG